MYIGTLRMHQVVQHINRSVDIEHRLCRDISLAMSLALDPIAMSHDCKLVMMKSLPVIIPLSDFNGLIYL